MDSLKTLKNVKEIHPILSHKKGSHSSSTRPALITKINGNKDKRMNIVHSTGPQWKNFKNLEIFQYRAQTLA